jgi:hypothetical protein
MVAEPADEVLIERRIADAEDVYTERVTRTGEVWRSTSVRARVVDGDLQFERSTPTWEHLGTLAPRALGTLRAAIEAPAVTSLPDTVEPSVAVIGGGEETWRVADRTIRVRGLPSATTPALAHLTEALDAAVSAAQEGTAN